MNISEEIRKIIENINKSTKIFQEDLDINLDEQLDDIFSIFKEKLEQEIKNMKKSTDEFKDNINKSNEKNNGFSQTSNEHFKELEDIIKNFDDKIVCSVNFLLDEIKKLILENNEVTNKKFEELQEKINLISESEKNYIKEISNNTENKLLDMQKKISDAQISTEEKLEIINNKNKDKYMIIISAVNMVLLIVSIIINILS